MTFVPPIRSGRLVRGLSLRRLSRAARSARGAGVHPSGVAAWSSWRRASGGCPGFRRTPSTC